MSIACLKNRFGASDHGLVCTLRIEFLNHYAMTVFHKIKKSFACLTFRHIVAMFNVFVLNFYHFCRIYHCFFTLLRNCIDCVILQCESKFLIFLSY